MYNVCQHGDNTMTARPAHSTETPESHDSLPSTTETEMTRLDTATHLGPAQTFSLGTSSRYARSARASPLLLMEGLRTAAPLPLSRQALWMLSSLDLVLGPRQMPPFQIPDSADSTSGSIIFLATRRSPSCWSMAHAPYAAGATS